MVFVYLRMSSTHMFPPRRGRRAFVVAEVAMKAVKISRTGFGANFDSGMESAIVFPNAASVFGLKCMAINEGYYIFE